MLLFCRVLSLLTHKIYKVFCSEKFHNQYQLVKEVNPFSFLPSINLIADNKMSSCYTKIKPKTNEFMFWKSPVSNQVLRQKKKRLLFYMWIHLNAARPSSTWKYRAPPSTSAHRGHKRGIHQVQKKKLKLSIMS